ncbi:hypothetical protein HN876_00595 [archaeon]|jgi:hypothetical protein|nr:hypothetical protein [archaeon]MBT7251399.1 hypothetical protein [archaeon]
MRLRLVVTIPLVLLFLFEILAYYLFREEILFYRTLSVSGLLVAATYFAVLWRQPKPVDSTSPLSDSPEEG